MTKLSRVYGNLIRIGKVSGAISFLIAAPYAVWQYTEAKGAARVEQTLGFFKQYNGTPFTTYREKISKALIKHNDKLVESAKNEKDLEQAQLKMIRDEDVEMELFLLFDFFDGLTECVVSEICDDATAVRLFKPRALDIYVNFYQYMKSKRDSVAAYNFGSGLEAVAKSGTPIRQAPSGSASR